MSTVPIPEGSVVITPMEVYREMQATHQAVRDVAAKLDGALVEHTHRLDAIDGPDGWRRDHEARLRGLEKWRWAGTGAATVLSSAAAAAITKVISKH